MATGTAPALDPKMENEKNVDQSAPAPAATFAQRLKAFLHQMFAGREEYLGWRQ